MHFIFSFTYIVSLFSFLYYTDPNSPSLQKKKMYFSDHTKSVAKYENSVAKYRNLVAKWFSDRFSDHETI